MRPRNRVELKCGNCGETFEVPASRTKRGRSKYCSKRCYTKSQIKKVDQQCEFCKGIFLVHPSRLKIGGGKYCSNKCYGRANSGENFWNWGGGVTPENKLIRNGIQYKTWRNAVFARDNWTCQDCGDNHGSNLHAHHIFPFAEFPDHRLDVWNGVTLCLGCHGKIHPSLKAQHENKMEE